MNAMGTIIKSDVWKEQDTTLTCLFTETGIIL